MTCEACGVTRPDITDGCCTRPSCCRTVLRAVRAERDALTLAILQAATRLQAAVAGVDSDAKVT